ncbi:hypothetical protein [Halobellus ruber]|uniref:Uncharacterized protein n=1 Tax=Halobellus ruber TaxID=2761102 RepID=A0A7J9SJ39_9EURY|nr:hypothetical protein [Halobellus ruber]MBB6646552.1 hypothetical protein [Halobellus ruber]
MTTPEADGGRFQAFDRNNTRSTQLWWCLEGIVGAGVAGLVVLVSYSAVTDLTAALGLLSSTAIAFLVLLAWVSVWSIIAATRDHLRTAPEARRG